MWAVCKKELRQFFSSLTGYIAIIAFLLLNGLLLFVFPDTDILAGGYATLDKFFELAPWILLLLIPAITMRSFADEFRMGTYEILQTLPLSRGRLIAGKYLASLIVVLIALLPTLLYFLCIQRLSGQAGIDTGGTIGSYIGLVCLSAVFTAIGIWCSCITANAVVAFIASAFACFLLYSGFGAISALPVFAAGLDYYIGMLGIDFHYRSISRGVIDTRDIIFFGSLIVLFLYLTSNNLAQRVGGGGQRKVGDEGEGEGKAGGEGEGKARGPGVGMMAIFVLLVGVNVVAAFVHYRLDLTAERRYTLSRPTKAMLSKVDDDIQVDFYLAGNLKAGFRQLSKSVQEELQDFNDYCGGRIRVHAFDPLAKLDDSAKQAFLDSISAMGIQPKTEVAQVGKGEGQTARIVIPGAVIRYRNRIYPVDLLKGVQVPQLDQPREQLYSNAETLLEYKFGSAIDKITSKEQPAIGYLLGNGEPLDYRVYDLIEGLRSRYRFKIVPLDSVPLIPSLFNAIVIVKPTTKFTEREKLSLDQYLLHGGQIIWAVSTLYAEQDSLQLKQQTIAYDRGLGLEDLFFKYGIRINQDLVEDMQSAKLTVVVGNAGGKPQTEGLPWPYYPLLSGSLTHPISKNLDPVLAEYANSIDTVKADGVNKTVLLQTSAHSRRVGTPAIITFEILKYKDDPAYFNQSNIPVAMLVEGSFHSLFENRLSKALADSLAGAYGQPFVPVSVKPGHVIVVADGDLFMNAVAERGPLPLGYSRDDGYQFANEDFINNCVEYLLNPSGILETRAKDFTLRLLDKAKVEADRSMCQFINIGLPLILVALGGYLYQLVRRRKYAVSLTV
ncbi:MAG TPA: gliding motility-associated ABC transporter substrate-binding protein GldG [Puia sp.]|jgi:ABC-2 type transport system permease protein|nr:gliding motility-associated ABC transporter substrate-binding protein GldG [Puia sp.]